MDPLRHAGKPDESAALGLPLHGVQFGGRTAHLHISGFRTKDRQRKLRRERRRRFVVEPPGTPSQVWEGSALVAGQKAGTAPSPEDPGPARDAHRSGHAAGIAAGRLPQGACRTGARSGRLASPTGRRQLKVP